MARVDFNIITAELDDLAGELQKRGHDRLAAKVDMVSNTLDAFRVASDPDKAPEGSPPGTQNSVQIADQFDATRGQHYGPTPVGDDSVSAVLGAESVSDILDRLSFAQRGKPEERQGIHIQASKSYEWPFSDISPEHLSRWAAAGEWSNVAKAARMAAGDKALDPNDDGLDLGKDDEDSLYSTGDLPASGSEDLVTDDIGPDQKGVLQVFDKTPAGTGDGPGHHGPTAASKAAAILKAAAKRSAEPVKVDTFSPDDNFGEGKPTVEEANSLGGKGKGSAQASKEVVATVKVDRPKYVPAHMSSVWNEVVEYTRVAGKLVAEGQVNYAELQRNYAKVLAEYNRVAASQCASCDKDSDDTEKDDEENNG